jgi:hypothetical protein
MEETGQTKIEDVNGCGIRLEARNNKVYDPNKKAVAKAVYDKALSECQTGTVQSTVLKRFKPRAKKPEQIN